jgi:hypothetical protein
VSGIKLMPHVSSFPSATLAQRGGDRLFAAGVAAVMVRWTHNPCRRIANRSPSPAGDVPLRETEARRLLRKLSEEGIFVVSPHARIEMNKDNLADVDVVNVLRAGVVQPAFFRPF